MKPMKTLRRKMYYSGEEKKTTLTGYGENGKQVKQDAANYKKLF